MIRHELNPLNLGGHLPHPLPQPSLKAPRKWAGKDNWILYRAYLQSDLNPPLPSEEASRLRPPFVAVKLGVRGLIRSE
ncbi:hypothetical protein AVEN_204346-1 [Araneus ventricosus]|uniref:Uncharacterized protein n=1 Tax=Araneus ventricosus TaxID=182803 RepID=A0A4Y2MRL0_ARAVE|nr:hypothetical protein AVEN_204346-1 [Araneus ventricosus]